MLSKLWNQWFNPPSPMPLHQAETFRRVLAYVHADPYAVDSHLESIFGEQMTRAVEAVGLIKHTSMHFPDWDFYRLSELGAVTLKTLTATTQRNDDLLG